jgi:hypothetical protein
MTALELVLAELEKFNKMYDDLQKEDWSKENFQVLSDKQNHERNEIIRLCKKHTIRCLDIIHQPKVKRICKK